MAVTAIGLPDLVHTPQLWRQAVIGGGYNHAGHPVTVIPGVICGLGVADAGGPNVSVAAGQCIITPADGLRGSYLVALDSFVSMQLVKPDTVYSRVDAVTVRVWDAQFGDAASSADLVQVTGTPAVAPVAPAIPPGSLLLATVTVPPSGAVAVNNDVKLWTSAVGAPLIGSRTQRTDLPTTYLRPGQLFTENSDSLTATPPGRVGQTWRWTGAAWVPDFVSGYRAYIGQVQRPYSWGYDVAIGAGKVYALPLRKASGAGFDERNNLPCTITNGANVVVPYAGRYRLKASIAADSKTTAAEFILGIRRNANVPTGSPVTDLGSPGGGSYGEIMDEQPMYMGNSATNAAHTVHTVEVPSYRLAAGDSLAVTLWHNSGSTQRAIYENPFISYLDIVRLGD